MSWLLRGLMVISGVALIYQGLPVASGALQAQKADGVVTRLRQGEKITTAQVSAGIAAFDKAIAVDPVAGHYLERSELEGGGALAQNVDVTPDQHVTWLKSASADLQLALTRAPARTIDWLRLASMKQGVDGPSRDIVGPLLMSIEMGRWIEYTYSLRLRLIVDNWGYFSDAQKAELHAYTSAMWRTSHDQRFFGNNIHNPVDELIIRNLLRDEPGAQEKITSWILTK